MDHWSKTTRAFNSFGDELKADTGMKPQDELDRITDAEYSTNCYNALTICQDGDPAVISCVEWV
ncbi:hypothetical protein P3T76_013506 [Phytophthora citrophthora]|uniref:Uncharacterized protein n=1 Tax=Phytophthora citrophthora TaxID=4793 RepID=A0AAD9G2R8_9STRA|nr:hypothetical protein P3T76_013506 [Phytophthora citrophthora]